MHAEPYIARQLSFGRDAGDETELLRKLNGVVIVLAEPGAGKSRLLKRLGEELGAKPIRASIFDADVDGGADALVIDALDEVARLDSSKVAGLLLKIRQCAANKVIIATRSAQWNQARGRLARDVFGEDPVEVRIAPLSQTQQRDLYQAKFGRDDFNAFRQALAQIDLDGLLGNPQFLLIFASAYVSRGGVVTTKSKVFHDAVLQLATEWNDDLDIPDRPQAEELTQVAGEVFATLLLSGASGICVKESHANRHFPFMSALSRSKTPIIKSTL